MTSKNERQNHQIDNFDLRVEEDRFLADVLADICWIMDSKNITQNDIAKRLNLTQARVSQILSGHGSNLTLRSLAKVMTALGEEVNITSPSLNALRDEVRRSTNWSEGVKHAAHSEECSETSMIEHFKNYFSNFDYQIIEISNSWSSPTSFVETNLSISINTSAYSEEKEVA